MSTHKPLPPYHSRTSGARAILLPEPVVSPRHPRTPPARPPQPCWVTCTSSTRPAWPGPTSPTPPGTPPPPPRPTPGRDFHMPPPPPLSPSPGNSGWGRTVASQQGEGPGGGARRGGQAGGQAGGQGCAPPCAPTPSGATEPCCRPPAPSVRVTAVRRRPSGPSPAAASIVGPGSGRRRFRGRRGERRG